MAEFSRIQVTPAEEEDIVIIAGAVEEPDAQDAGPVAPADELVQEAVSASHDFALSDTSSSKRSSEDAYRETTLDDLHQSRMSGTQKAVIALALVALIAFIIWYVLLR